MNGQTHEKKGIHPLAWAGIGCGVISLIVVVVIGVGAFWIGNKAKEIATDPSKGAELFVKLHPELDHVSTDREAGTITIRNKKDGELMTVNFDDLTDGKFSIEGEDGESVFSIDANDENGVTIQSQDGKGQSNMQFGGTVTLENVPDWVPIYPNTKKNVSAVSRTKPDGNAAGNLTFEIDGDVAAVIDYYKPLLEQAGYTLDERQVSANGQPTQFFLTANHPDGQVLSIIVSDSGGQRMLIMNYEKK